MSTKTTMYRVSGFGITEREIIIKQSEKSVYGWFDTKEKAIEYIKSRLESQIESTLDTLQHKKELLLKFQNKVDNGEL